MPQSPVRHCPTCACEKRQRFTVDRDLLSEVARRHQDGGIAAVQEAFGRSRSQAYRLVSKARQVVTNG